MKSERKEITYDLRTKDLCKLPMTKKRYGSESLSFRGSLLWNTLNDKIKQSLTLAAFKNQNKIMDWWKVRLQAMFIMYFSFYKYLSKFIVLLGFFLVLVGIN